MSLSRWLILLFGLVIVLFTAVILLNRRNPIQACTMDAKVCPDGSSVGRVLPNCEFAPCPGNQEVTPEPDIPNSFDSYTPEEP